MRLLYLLYHIVVILSRGEIIENENFRDDIVQQNLTTRVCHLHKNMFVNEAPLIDSLLPYCSSKNINIKHVNT